MSACVFFFDVISFSIHVTELISILYTHILGITDNKCIAIENINKCIDLNEVIFNLYQCKCVSNLVSFH